MHFVDLLDIHASNAIKIHDRITFNFYMGLAHMHVISTFVKLQL